MYRSNVLMEVQGDKQIDLHSKNFLFNDQKILIGLIKVAQSE